MSSLRYIKYDIRQMLREPIITILLLLPVLLLFVAKLLLKIANPYSIEYLGVGIFEYGLYISSSLYLLIPGLIGTVIGFMMLDDKDGRIYELMSITPLGREGYFINRIFFPSVIVIIYSFIAHMVLNYVRVNIAQLLFIIILLIMQTIIISLILFHLADDKVKGLTYSKLLNASMAFAFADLFNSKLLNTTAYIFPQYWITKIQEGMTLQNMAIAISVHLLWCSILFNKFLKSKKV